MRPKLNVLCWKFLHPYKLFKSTLRRFTFVKLCILLALFFKAPISKG